MKLKKSQLALLIEHYLEEGFFDLKDSPVLRRLGVVDGEESTPTPAPDLPNKVDPSNDPWVNLELAISTIPTILAVRYGPQYRVGEEPDGGNAAKLFRPKIARHLDFDNDNVTGDKDDILISFEKLKQIDADFVEGESVPSNQVALDFCKSVKRLGTSFIESFVDRPELYDINMLKQVFDTYLEKQQEINSSFFADVLNNVAETIIEKNIKSLIAIAAKEKPDSFTFVADDEFDPSKGVLTFPFQISLMAQSDNQSESPIGGAYFKVDCELDFTDIYRQFENPQVLFGPLLDINFSWKIKVQRSPETIPDIATIPVRVRNLNRPELFKFIAGLNKLAKDIVSLSVPFSTADVKKLKKTPRNNETFKQIVYYSTHGEIGVLRNYDIRQRRYNNKPTYLTDSERKIQVTRELLSAVKHLKTEQSKLLKSVRAYDRGSNAHDALRTAERMVSVIEEIPDLDYLGQTDFVLSDYFKKLKIFIENYPYSDERDYRGEYYPQSEAAVKEFREYVLGNNQKIVQGIRKQIRVLEGELNESVSHLIFERAKRHLKV